MATSKVLFAGMDVTRQSFFCCSRSLAFGIVNLRPILPGHVLAIPSRAVPRLSDLESHELHALFDSVQRIGSAVEKAFNAEGLTIACQDGKAAGQSVPHVHVHIIPRGHKEDKFAGSNDDVYPAIEGAEEDLRRPPSVEPLRVDDEGRMPRSTEDMEAEAIWLRGFFSQ